VCRSAGCGRRAARRRSGARRSSRRGRQPFRSLRRLANRVNSSRSWRIGARPRGLPVAATEASSSASWRRGSGPRTLLYEPPDPSTARPTLPRSPPSGWETPPRGKKVRRSARRR
jgi:hypothetical protein